MKKNSQFLYRTSKSRIKDIKIRAIEENKPVNEILDHLIDEFLGKKRKWFWIYKKNS